MAFDLTILIPSIASKLVLSKLIALRLTISKFAVTNPWIYHILPTSNLRLIKIKSKYYLVKILSFTPGYSATKIIKQYHKEIIIQ